MVHGWALAAVACDRGAQEDVSRRQIQPEVHAVLPATTATTDRDDGADPAALPGEVAATARDVRGEVWAAAGGAD